MQLERSAAFSPGSLPVPLPSSPRKERILIALVPGPVPELLFFFTKMGMCQQDGEGGGGRGDRTQLISPPLDGLGRGERKTDQRRMPLGCLEHETRNAIDCPLCVCPVHCSHTLTHTHTHTRPRTRVQAIRCTKYSHTHTNRHARTPTDTHAHEQTHTLSLYLSQTQTTAYNNSSTHGGMGRQNQSNLPVRAAINADLMEERI